MINYKSFSLPGNAKLRVRAENIVATVSSKDKNTVDVYVAGLALPFHIPISDTVEARELMDYTWERHMSEDKEI